MDFFFFVYYYTIHSSILLSSSFFFFPGGTGEDLYELFGKYGAIRQIRLGDQPQKTKGTAFIVFEEIGDAKMALDRLNGFHLQERYIVGEYDRLKFGFVWDEYDAHKADIFLSLLPFFKVLYHMPSRSSAKADLARREAELEELKRLHDIRDE